MHWVTGSTVGVQGSQMAFEYELCSSTAQPPPAPQHQQDTPHQQHAVELAVWSIAATEMGSNSNSNSKNHQRGTIEWCLAQAPVAASAGAESRRDASNTRPFKQPRVKPVQQQTTRPHLALRSSNRCQQLLSQELGWRCPPSLNTWQSTQQQQLACVCLRATPCHGSSGSFRTPSVKTPPITCLELQQPPCTSSGSNDSSNSSMHHHTLAAIGDAAGRLHVCRVSRLQAAATAACNAAAALPPDVCQALMAPDRWARQAAAAGGVPEGSGCIPTAAAASEGGTGLLSIDTQCQLRSCCWLQRQQGGLSEGVLVTSGSHALMQHAFAEGRTASSSLRAKGGNVVMAPGQVVSLDAQAAYQLAATAGKALLLWDLRAGPSAAATLPLQAAPEVLRGMPGGQLLLTAEPNGQIALYDVRRLSSSSSIVNFGSSRASQQALLTHNLRSRAAAAGYGYGSSSSSGGGVRCSALYRAALEQCFLSDVVVNPLDPNLLAYVKPEQQVGLFDLCSGQVLQQVPLSHHIDSSSSSSTDLMAVYDAARSAHSALDSNLGLRASSSRQACWDSSGHVLYAGGMLSAWISLQEAAAAGSNSSIGSSGDVAYAVTSTLAAVDFGSWHGRRQRWLGSNGGSSGSNRSSARVEEAGGGADTDSRQQGEKYAHDANSSSSSSRPQLFPCQGVGYLFEGGQVLHRELHWTAAPTTMAAAGAWGNAVLVGTQAGDVLWVS